MSQNGCDAQGHTGPTKHSRSWDHLQTLNESISQRQKSKWPPKASTGTLWAVLDLKKHPGFWVHGGLQPQKKVDPETTLVYTGLWCILRQNPTLVYTELWCILLVNTFSIKNQLKMNLKRATHRIHQSVGIHQSSIHQKHQIRIHQRHPIRIHQSHLYTRTGQTTISGGARTV